MENLIEKKNKIKRRLKKKWSITAAQLEGLIEQEGKGDKQIN